MIDISSTQLIYDVNAQVQSKTGIVCNFSLDSFKDPLHY